MVLTITITPEYWDVGMKYTIQDRARLYDTLMHVIAPFLSKREDIGSVTIVLPSTVNKSERYLLHRLTRPNHFEPHSFDSSSDERVMHIRISKVTVLEMFKDYVFQPPSPPPATVNERKRLSNSLIQFVQNEFQDEFAEYLNTI